MNRALLLALVAVGLAMPPSAGADAVSGSKVYLNGVPYPVYFNDGDSFRVLAGPLGGSKARLAGFNTLESYGKTHSWGGWDEKELYHNAKMGTYNARRGPCWDAEAKRYKAGCNKAWHCTSDLKRDGYGRILWWCPDLAESQVRLGFAHVMSVRGPGHPDLIRAQADAIKHRRGMWAHGVPRYVVTSLHSNDEPWFKGFPYNRMVSSKDGSSRKWKHRRFYSECTKVCWHDVKLTPDALAVGVQTLRAAEPVKPYLNRYSDEELQRLLEAYRLNGDLGLLKGDKALRKKSKDAYYAALGRQAEAFDGVLGELEKSGKLTIASKTKGACMVHASFFRRYGSRSAACLH